MAIENFEGKNIQDTFQRVVQTDSTNQLADGTGSIFIPVSSSHAITASHALFAVSASHEITFEISSSHAVNADTASFASGNILGDSIRASSGFVGTINTITQPNITSVGTLTGLNVNGNITSSGNISASGDLFVRNIRINDPNGGTTFEIDTSTGDGKIRFTDNNSVKWDLGRDNTQQNFVISNGSGLDTNDLFILTTENNIQLNGPVTASGEISASGVIKGLGYFIEDNILADMAGSTIALGYQNNTPIQIGRSANPTLIVGHLTASGNISASGELSVTDNAFIGGKLSVNTTSTTARVNIVGSQAHQLTGGANTFKITGVSSANALFVSSSTKVGIGTQTPGEQLEVVGNISASGDLTVNNINGTIDGGTF